MSELEDQLGIEKQEVNGVSVKTSLAGFGGSSTRAEIAAGILALSAKGGVHI